jgi:DivIVA domain-containing protein
VGSFLLVVVAAIILAGIVFGAGAFTLGRDRGLTPPRPDGVPFDLPPDRPLDRADVEQLRLDTALRGYRMDQVDTVLGRMADDLDFLYARIADLEDQLAEQADHEQDAELEFDLPAWPEQEQEHPGEQSEPDSAEEIGAETVPPATARPAGSVAPALPAPPPLPPTPTQPDIVTLNPDRPEVLASDHRNDSDRSEVSDDSDDGASEVVVPRPSRSGGRRG